jgi:hypothetical protein
VAVTVAFGIAGRSGARGRALVMHELVEDLIHQSEMSRGIGELGLDVDEVVGEPVEPGRGHLEDGEGCSGSLGEERQGILHDVHPHLAHRANRRGGGSVENDGHLTEHRPGLVDPCERHPVVLHDHRSRSQHEHPGRQSPFGDQHLTGFNGFEGQVGTECEKVGHAPSVLELPENG